MPIRTQNPPPLASFLMRVWLILREIFTNPFRTTYVKINH